MVGVTAAGMLAVLLFLDTFIVLVSLFMLVVARADAGR